MPEPPTQQIAARARTTAQKQDRGPEPMNRSGRARPNWLWIHQCRRSSPACCAPECTVESRVTGASPAQAFRARSRFRRGCDMSAPSAWRACNVRPPANGRAQRLGNPGSVGCGPTIRDNAPPMLWPPLSPRGTRRARAHRRLWHGIQTFTTARSAHDRRQNNRTSAASKNVVRPTKRDPTV